MTRPGLTGPGLTGPGLTGAELSVLGRRPSGSGPDTLF
jgi:hypothetical protein